MGTNFKEINNNKRNKKNFEEIFLCLNVQDDFHLQPVQ